MFAIMRYSLDETGGLVAEGTLAGGLDLLGGLSSLGGLNGRSGSGLGLSGLSLLGSLGGLGGGGLHDGLGGRDDRGGLLNSLLDVRHD